jgi:hypothetical protein
MMSSTGCAAVIITIATSGGITGMGDPAGTKTVDTSALAAETRKTICAAFDADALARLAEEAKLPSRERGADRFTYRITIKDSGGKTQIFDLPEHVLPPATLDLIDEL